MNTKQLNQLKKGDEVFIRARYKAILGDGDVLFSHSVTNAYDEVVREDSFTHPENIILPSELQPTPKYDPCRPLKKGDKVKLREEVQGRKTSRFVTGLSLGKIYTVETDEFNHTVDIVGDEGLGRYSFVHLELVTPVEEPYIIEEYAIFYAVEKDGAQYSIFFKGSYHAKAKEAAEAECARLNEEYRKGVCNG